MKVNYVALVLDASWSMNPIRQPTETAFRNMLRNLREQARTYNQKTYVTCIGFNDRPFVMMPLVDVDQLNDNTFTYRPDGNTALFDAVGDAIEALPRCNPTSKDDISFLVLAYTDGEENHSTRWNSKQIRDIIERLQNGGHWTFAFQMPPGYGTKFSRTFGIPAENIREWENTERGVEEAAQVTTSSMDGYFQARANGLRSVKSFYTPVTTNLANVKVKAVRTKLTDLSKHFKVYTVDKEAVVKDFVENKTGKGYVIGQAYYMLMKSEKIQPNKGVLLMEKGKKTVWGGPAARDMIGLPRNEHARVTPGNHADYDIYVQSTSTNRKLPRGTKVLVDAKQQVSMQPTWVAP